MIDLLQIDMDLIKPTMRAAVEEQLNMIASGKVNFEAVLTHSLDIFCRKFKYFVVNITGMDELFEVSFSPLAASGRPLSRWIIYTTRDIHVTLAGNPRPGALILLKC